MVFCSDELMTYHRLPCKISVQNWYCFLKHIMRRPECSHSIRQLFKKTIFMKHLIYLKMLKSFKKSDYQASCHQNNIFEAKCFNMLPYTHTNTKLEDLFDPGSKKRQHNSESYYISDWVTVQFWWCRYRTFSRWIDRY